MVRAGASAGSPAAPYRDAHQRGCHEDTQAGGDPDAGAVAGGFGRGCGGDDRGRCLPRAQDREVGGRYRGEFPRAVAQGAREVQVPPACWWLPRTR
jgi:hypothetical protein